MPACFKENFGTRLAVIIINCFEIFTEKLSGLVNMARCWSNYKHHQTVKYLIGITAQGTISYISDSIFFTQLYIIFRCIFTVNISTRYMSIILPQCKY
nr:unnamed protein product [Callosobruchus analis]